MPFFSSPITTILRARSRRLAVLVALFTASGCAARTPPKTAPPPESRASSPIDAIGELKTFEGTLGGGQTQNFLRYSPQVSSDERCYYTGKLELPEFYSGLHLAREDEPHCLARAGSSDVFFYPVQAVASGQETITVGLAEAPVERVFVVVPH